MVFEVIFVPVKLITVKSVPVACSNNKLLLNKLAPVEFVKPKLLENTFVPVKSTTVKLVPVALLNLRDELNTFVPVKSTAIKLLTYRESPVALVKYKVLSYITSLVVVL